MLILASESPRRRNLLAEAGFEFATCAPGVVEHSSLHLTLREITAHNAMRKAMAVARVYPRDVVLAADTLVALDGVTIGKPRDLAHARAILKKLSGRTHLVCSGVFICRRDRGLWSCFTEQSEVRFRPLNDAAIDRYLKKVDPLDKAGAYGAQDDEGNEIIEVITGSFTNVIGLPLEKTVAVLRDFDVFAKENRRVATR